MAQEAVRLVSPVGRIIWGSVYERATQDYDGKPYEEGKGPFQFGLAIRKDAPGINEFLAKLYEIAMQGYATNPHLQQRITNEWQSGFAGLSFRFKIKDGDKPNANGQVNENARGCWVFAMSTSLPIKGTHYGLQFTTAMGQPVPNNGEIEISKIERGYYADVSLTAKVNDNTDGTAGLYLNPSVVRLVAYGEKIVGGISTEEAFATAAAPAYMPPGASTTPIGGAPAALPQPVAGTPAPGMAPVAGTPAPGMAPVAGTPAPLPTTGAPGAVQTGTQPLPGAQAGTPGLPTASPTNIQPHTGFLPGAPGGAVGMPGQ